jgi:hypothetical protein
VILNYMCPSVVAVARGVLRPFESAKNHCFSNKIVVGLVNSLGLSPACGQRKSRSFTGAFEPTTFDVVCLHHGQRPPAIVLLMSPRNLTATRSNALASALCRAILFKCGVILYIMTFSGDVSL